MVQSDNNEFFFSLVQQIYRTNVLRCANSRVLLPLCGKMIQRPHWSDTSRPLVSSPKHTHTHVQPSWLIDKSWKIPIQPDMVTSHSTLIRTWEVAAYAGYNMRIYRVFFFFYQLPIEDDLISALRSFKFYFQNNYYFREHELVIILRLIYCTKEKRTRYYCFSLFNT